MKIFNKKASSRIQIRIKEVKDGVLVLPGQKYRMVLETSAVNFELKSEVEQDAITETYQHFLNSLPSQIQILVRIREVDIESYVQNFMKENNHEKEKVYKDQLKNYTQFIRKLVSGNKIMSRNFYIIIPFTPKEGKNDFEYIKQQLKLNGDIIAKGLEKVGMKTRTLGNLEILDLFYGIYNSSHIKTQPLRVDSFNHLFKNAYVI